MVLVISISTKSPSVTIVLKEEEKPNDELTSDEEPLVKVRSFVMVISRSPLVGFISLGKTSGFLWTNSSLFNSYLKLLSI